MINEHVTRQRRPPKWIIRQGKLTGKALTKSNDLNLVQLSIDYCSWIMTVWGPARQCSHGEIIMLEKTTGYQHLSSVSVLYRGNPDIPGIIVECRRMCELNYECRGFTLDYLKQECYSGSETSVTKPKELIPAENKAYFEGICLPFYLGCSKQWMFDRYVDKELRGVQARDVIRLVSRANCERRCLEEKRFVCRSANYYRYNQECRLFSEEQSFPHTQLSYASGVEYLENQCNVGTSTCPYRLPERDLFMVYTSKAIPGISNFELCRQLCRKEQDFNCRSYSYLEQGGINDLCLLSSENRQTGQAKAIRYRLRSLYEEVECRGQIPGTSLPPPPTAGTPGTSSPTPTPQTPPTLRPPTQVPPIPNRCTFEQFTYEKVVNYNLRFGRKERLITRSPTGVVTECQAHCQRLGERCKGFVIEYATYQQLCFWLDAYSTAVDNTIVPAQNTAYFEKICLSEPPCGKLWSFDRVPGYDFHDVPDLEVPGVPRRTDCEDLCLTNVPPCRSATYDTFRRVCRLFSEDRRSKPNAFVRDLPEMEYLENQCSAEPATCEYRTIPDRFFPYIDRLSRAYSLADCQRQCDLEQKFVCRSLNFETVVRDCALSSDDLISIQPGPDGLHPRPNSIYSEKGSCEQVSVQCNQQDMLLTVNFGTPFHGRVYAKGNPTQCYMVGTGQTTLLFAISLGSRCGTLVEGSGRYANEVVIQQHPVIVTNIDKTIKVVCSFETLDRTVTLGGLFPGASPGLDVTTRFLPPVTAIVTNTAPPPNVVMRVLDRTGRDAGVVGLGDELMLRIELRDQASNLAIFARNLYARSKNGESLFLIDSTGCPTDPSIFPTLSLDARDRKSLFANFKAFRFPSTGLVNFEVQIRFCQDQCKTVRCANNVESFGRKKRDITETTDYNDTSNGFNSTLNESLSASPNGQDSGMTGSYKAEASIMPPNSVHSSSSSNTYPRKLKTARVTQVFGTFTSAPHIKKVTNSHSRRNITEPSKTWLPKTSSTSVHSNEGHWTAIRKSSNSWRYHTTDGLGYELPAIVETAVRFKENETHQINQNDRLNPNKVNGRSEYFRQASRTAAQPLIRHTFAPPENLLYSPRQVNDYRHTLLQNGVRHSRIANPPYGVPPRDQGIREDFEKAQTTNNKVVSSYDIKHRTSSVRYHTSNTKQQNNSSADETRSSGQTLDDTVASSLTTPELVISTMVPVPDELPLSLAIMVGEDPGVDVSSWKTNPSPINLQETKDDVGLVCTSVTTIAATAVSLSVLHVLGLVGAYCCCKWHRKSKRKKILQNSLKLPRPAPMHRRTSGAGRTEELFYAKPDVSFRNVYGSYESSP